MRQVQTRAPFSSSFLLPFAHKQNWSTLTVVLLSCSCEERDSTDVAEGRGLSVVSLCRHHFNIAMMNWWWQSVTIFTITIADPSAWYHRCEVLQALNRPGGKILTCSSKWAACSPTRRRRAVACNHLDVSRGYFSPLLYGMGNNGLLKQKYHQRWR